MHNKKTATNNVNVNLETSLNTNKLAQLYYCITNEELKCYYSSSIINEKDIWFKKIINSLLKATSKNSNDQIKIFEKYYQKNFLEDINFLQISLEETDISNYENIGKSLKDYGDYSKYCSDSFPTREEFLKKIDNSFYSEETEYYKTTLKRLSYGEMKSIYVYTSACFTKINTLLRENIYLSSLNLDNSIILINAAVAAHTINKISREINKNKPSSCPIVIREEHNFNLEKYETNLNSPNIIKNLSFTSTIFKYDPSNEFNKKEQGVKVLFKNTEVGAYISPLSQRPYEHEFLFPPGIEYKITGCMDSFYGYIFTAEILNIHNDSSIELTGQAIYDT